MNDEIFAGASSSVAMDQTRPDVDPPRTADAVAPLERVPVGGERDGVSLGARDAYAPPAAAVGD